MAIEIIQAGVLTTLQDLGRSGYRAQGVVLSGAMDGFAHRVANWLVGNDENQPTLEITMGGLEIVFHEPALIALGGFGVRAFLNQSPMDCWKSTAVQPRDRLKVMYAGYGCRSYLAVAGGWQISEVLGSYSTYASAGWGGFRGRALRKGDQIAFTPKPSPQASWSIASSALPEYSSNPKVRVIEGPEWDWFTQESQRHWLEENHSVLPQSNRMGYRLKAALERSHTGELLSTAVSPGTLQVLPDGNLVLLMNDAPATGGYPRIAQVIEADLCICAQLTTGNEVRFVRISAAEAEEIYVSSHQHLQLLKQSIFQRLYAN
ncbi:biotin-dependent carboxyltransferase family protein [Siphonobacter sp. SORGH_AS_1065]|uniref:5-oxoprolinase subunit C family protein n=1 Tax=Siphonobacter sp. SORGH_AS_1065 TaxID=3041795 RepID=UPI0027D86311|nr:biotin-dependent carboxyltransferase family protein [Siphonobacter sp. SORGH_AS_1065]